MFKISFILKVHVDQSGIAWYLPGEGVAKCSGETLDDFLNGRKTLIHETVQLIGSKDNAATIVSLYIMKIRGLLKHVQVCSPALCTTKDDIPHKYLLNMSRISGMPASLGGWHEVDENDYISYSLANRLNKSDIVDDDVRRLLKDHPAWPALSFIGHLDHDNLARLLALIIDPRWFIDPRKPDKSSRLESYLGLHPKTQLAVSEGGPYFRGYANCSLVLKTWKNSYANIMNTEFTPLFLWRICMNHGQGFMGDLRASQKFTSFLRLVWLSSLHGKNFPNSERLFVPEYFFKTSEEAQAFKDHIENFKIL